MKNFILILICILLSRGIFAQTIIPAGNISGNWTTSGSPYLVYGDVVVPYGNTLSISPGVKVIFQGNYWFEVQGTLNASGTLNDSITFTLADTTGFANGTNPGWKGIIRYYSYNVLLVIEYCIIEYGGLEAFDSDLTIRHCAIRKSRANGINVLSSSSFLMEYTTIKKSRNAGMSISNMAPNYYVAQLNNFTITDNNSVGIGLGYESTAILSNGIISNNKLQGISTINASYMEIENCLIENNGNTLTNGGGIYTKGIVYLNEVRIRNNKALNGGGIYCFPIELGSLNVDNSIIENNLAVENGGGIYKKSGTLVSFSIQNSVIKNNQALNGGGLYCGGNYPAPGYSQTVRITKTEFSNNQSVNNGGGIFKTEHDENSGIRDYSKLTIVNNTAGISGGGIYSEITVAPNTFKNLIVWDNEPQSIVDLNSMLSIVYSDIEGGWTGTGNINSDPLFRNAGNEDYQLTWINFPALDYTKSPCIETGDPLSPADPDGTVADMGAYYFDQTGFNTITMDIKAFLQGPFVNNLMVPNLNMQGLIPLHHPYSISPWNHFGTESVSSIPNSNVIDWVFIEIRKLNNTDDLSDYYPVFRQAAFIMKNGTIRNLSNNLISFFTKENDSLYICVFHRNHVPIMSSLPISSGANPVIYDFTNSPEKAMGGIHVQNQLSATAWGMIASDGSKDGQVDNRDKNDNLVVQNAGVGYLLSDYTMNGVVNNSDWQLWDSNCGKGNKFNFTPFTYRCGYSFTDDRNGQSYRTVQIGAQCWMAENLNIGTQISGSLDMSNNSQIEKYCYDDNTNNCGVYGGLYQWDEMMNYTMVVGAQGICPSGWHIPPIGEFNALVSYLGGTNTASNKLREVGTAHWNPPNTGATNSSGFTALPGGSRWYYPIEWIGLGDEADFWSSTYSKFLFIIPSYADWEEQDDVLGLSIRCIKN